MTDPDPLSRLRQAYAERVCTAACVNNPRLLSAFASVRRENYSPPGPWNVYRPTQQPPYFEYARTATTEARELYSDLSIELAPDSFINNGLPSVIAGWLKDTAPPVGGRTIQIGAGLGYYTAILAHLVGPQGAVRAAEINREIGRQARENLADLPQVDLLVGDGGSLEVDGADLVMVHAGVSDLPIAWVTGLSPRGALVVSLTFTDPAFRTIGLGVTLEIRPHSPGCYAARFVSMPYITTSRSLRSEAGEAAVRAAMESCLDYSDIASLRLASHRPDESCWMHRETWCVSRRPPDASH